MRDEINVIVDISNKRGPLFESRADAIPKKQTLISGISMTCQATLTWSME